jgi:hypothetical protein
MVAWRIRQVVAHLNDIRDPFLFPPTTATSTSDPMTAQDDISAALTSLDAATARVATIVASAASTAASLQATIDTLTAQLATGLTPQQTADAVTHLTSVVAQLNALGSPAAP